MTLARRQNCAAKHAVEGCDHVTRSVRAWLAAYELSDDACEAFKIVPPSMLSKAATMLRVVAERGLLRTTHDARTCTLMPNKSVALSTSACQVSLH